GVEGHAVDQACRAMRPLRTPASSGHVVGRPPDTSGRGTAGRIEGAVPAGRESQSRAGFIRLFAGVGLAPVVAMEDACRSSGAGGAWRSIRAETAVNSGASFGDEVCRIRRQYSPPVCSGYSCARRPLRLAAGTQRMV